MNQNVFLRIKDYYHFLSEVTKILYIRKVQKQQNIYDINGFHIRFFTKQDIEFFMKDKFKILKIIEDYEEPASLCFVICYKNEN